MKRIELKPVETAQTSQSVQIIPLCGLEQIGGNSAVVRYKDQIVVIDAGLGFPDSEVYGIDYFIPNLEYLKKNKDKIEGIIITHGHLDHIGALAHFLEALDFPEVYASSFALELIKIKLEEKGILNKARLVEVKLDSVLKSKDIGIEFFKVNHSIPESMGVVIKTPAGNIVHTGDFKFDNTPVNEPVADYGRIASIGAEGVLALMSDSTNSFKEGHSISESNIEQMLEEVCEDAEGRIIAATFSSLVNRLYQLIRIAHKLKRKVYISGRSMEAAIAIARKTGYIDVPDELFIKAHQLKKYDDDRLMILATGAQGENMAALARMSRGEHRDVNIKKGDTVILSASVIPGNETLVQRMIDELSKRGAYVFHKNVLDLHTSGHGYKEDQKLMINLVKPRYFIPVHGYQSFLSEHARTAMQIGIPKSRIIIAENGDILELSAAYHKKAGKVEAEPLFVSGLGVGDIGAKVLKDREQLANYGVIVVFLTIDKQSGRLLTDPTVLSRGFVYVNENIDLFKEIQDIARQAYRKELIASRSYKNLKKAVSGAIQKHVYKTIKREPMILVHLEPIFKEEEMIEA